MRAPLLLMLLCLAAGAYAAPLPAGAKPAESTVRAVPQATVLTLDEAVAAALAHNPDLAAAAEDIAAAKSGVRSAAAPANPTLEFAPPITPNGSENVIVLKQPLELNGTRGARTAIAAAQLRRRQSAALVEVRDTVFSVKKAYFELAKAEELWALNRELLQIAEEFDRVARREVALGTRPGIETAQTGLEVTQARQQVALAVGQVTSARAVLNTLMGRDPRASFAVILPEVNVPRAGLDESKLVAQALQQRAELAEIAAAAEGYKQEARLTRAEGRPDLVPQFLAGGQFLSDPRDAGLGVVVTLPIFDYGSRKQHMQQAEESARAEEDRLEAARNQVRQEVVQAVAQLSAAQSVVQDYQEAALEQAQRLLDSTRAGFEAGRASILQVVEAERSYRLVKTDYLNAQVDLGLAQAELEYATGAFTPPPGPVVASEARK